MKVYISGPISGNAPNTNKEERKERFNRCEAWINEHRSEWKVVNPLKVQACADHACGGDHDGHTWQCWLRYDIIAMLECDAIVILPGWQWSEGSKLEQKIAQALHMKVYMANKDGVVVI